MGQIEPADRAREAREAWSLYIEGKSKTEIARRLGRNWRTITNYLDEAAEWQRDEGLDTKRAAMVASHRKIIEKAWDMLESGDIKPTSLAGPQYLMQVREALKEIARIEGLYVERKEVLHGIEGRTLKDLITERYGTDGEYEDEDLFGDVVDGEVVEDEGGELAP